MFAEAPFKEKTFNSFIQSCQQHIDPSITAENVDEKVAEYLKRFSAQISFTSQIHTYFPNQWRKWTQPKFHLGNPPLSKVEIECIKIKMACESIQNPLISFLYSYPIMESLSNSLDVQDLLELEKIRNTPALISIIRKKVADERTSLSTIANINTVAKAIAFTKKYRLDVLNLTDIQVKKNDLKVIAALSYKCIVIRTDNNFKQFKNNTHLQCLDLSYSPQYSLKYLAECIRLEELYLSHSHIINLQFIENLIQLRKLDFSYCENIDDADLLSLTTLTNLEYLNLEGANLKGTAFELLANLTRLNSLNLYETRFNGSRIKYLRAYSRLESLHLPEKLKLNHDEIEDLCSHTTLKKLSLTNCEDLTDHRMRHIADLINLEELNISECSSIRSEGLRHISGLTKLEHLNLRESIDDDSALKYLAKLTNLRSLILDFMIVDGNGLKYLERFHQLKYLSVQNLRINSPFPIFELTSLRMLKCCCNTFHAHNVTKLTNLKELVLQECDLTDEVLGSISNLLELQKLNIMMNPQISDKGLMQLTTLKNLRELNAEACSKITDHGKKMLLRKLPSLKM